jgi:hypothetical protein
LSYHPLYYYSRSRRLVSATLFYWARDLNTVVQNHVCHQKKFWSSLVVGM